MARDDARLIEEINDPLTALLGHLELMSTALDERDVSRVRHHLAESVRLAQRIGAAARRLTHDPTR